MATLKLTISSITEADYNGVDETVKKIVCEIDDIKLPHQYFKENSKSDATCKNEVKTDLTDKGYTWQDEI